MQSWKNCRAVDNMLLTRKKSLPTTLKNRCGHKVFLEITLRKHFRIPWFLTLGCSLPFVEERIIVDIAIIHHNWYSSNLPHNCHLLGMEDPLEMNQGGLKHKKQAKKEVVHYANTANPKCCLIRLYKLYYSCCPYNSPALAFVWSPYKILREMYKHVTV